MSDGAARYDVLIVGGGHGGAQAAIALRQAGYAGSIAIVGAEPELPYERPALSKDYLAGAKPFERILIRPAAFWQDRDIALLPGRRIVRLRAAAHEADADDGTTFGYGRLIWAAGGDARRLGCEGGDLANVHSVRTRHDADRIIADMADGNRVVIVGGGYVGLEAAAVLTSLGKKVAVLEALPRVLARVAGEPLSRFYEAEHRARGVAVRLDAQVAAFEAAGQRASAVRLADGTRVPCDLVIVGIGIAPAVAPLAEAGAIVADGVVIDEFCRTSLPDVFAVGDCAAHPNRFARGSRIRLESVQNANDQAVTAANRIAGAGRPYDAVPWFWSNQYDLRLQTVGLSVGHDQIVVRGEIDSRSFALVYLREGRVIALDCVNATRDYVQGRALVVAGARIAPGLLADPARPLKDLAADVA